MLPVEDITNALISLAVGTLLGTEITRWLYRPKVYIRYEDVEPLFSEDGIYLTIKVANLGRTVANNCKGIITIESLDRKDLLDKNEANPEEDLPGYPEEAADREFPRPQLLNPKNFREISGESLAWATLGNPAMISINPGVTEMLDIFKIQEYELGNYIIIPSEHGWRHLRARMRQRNLKGRIMICPSNEFPTLIYFELLFDETGNSSFIVHRPGRVKRLQRLFFRRRYYFG